MSELGHELAVGDAAKIRASEPRQQKYDDRIDALPAHSPLTRLAPLPFTLPTTLHRFPFRYFTFR
ncbi:MAG: hypothetical protein ACRD2P_03695 [Terriglobia bacterium]